MERPAEESGSGSGNGPGGGVLNDSVFCQVPELQVPVGFPWAHHRDVSAKTLHAGDVVPESDWTKTRGMSM